MATEVRRLSLVDGPSKFGLMLALFDPLFSNRTMESDDQCIEMLGQREMEVLTYNSGVRLVTFSSASKKGQDRRRHQVEIWGLERLEGTTLWKFSGRIIDFPGGEGERPRSRAITGRFSTQTRKGSAEITTEE